MMDLAMLDRLIELVERSRVTELVYVEGGIRVRIAKQPVAPLPQTTAAPLDPPVLIAPHQEPTPAAPASNHVMKSGMAGTFYRAAAPGEAPFCSEGDAVQEGQTLAILEAMKMLNPLESDRTGTIVRILVADAASIEVGTPLFEISEA